MLVCALCLCLALFVEDRIEALMPQVKNYAEARVEEMLGGRARFSIGSIEGGIFKPITLNDIKISGGKSDPMLSSVDIPAIRTTYRVWDLLIGNGRNVFGAIFAGGSHIDINFTVAKKDLSGFVRLGVEPKGGLSFKGYANIFGKDKVDFSGILKDEYVDIEFRPLRGVVRSRIYTYGDDSLKADIDIEHIKLYGFDVACKGTLTNSFKAGYSQGQFRTADKVILNYTPFLNFAADYRVDGDKLDILSVDMENEFSAKGRITFKEPRSIDVTALANNVNLSWLMGMMGARDATEVLTGTMNGKFELKGKLDDIKSDIKIEIRKGTMATLDFDCMNAEFKGEGPVLRIEDSRITRESGTFSIAGEIDLTKAGKPTLFDNLKMASDDRAINWDSLDTRSVGGVREVRMNKKLIEGINIDFTKYLKEEGLDESSRYEDEMKLEYKLDTNESLKMMLGSNNDFFGIEHRDRF
jgi:hypothetical protein